MNNVDRPGHDNHPAAGSASAPASAPSTPPAACALCKGACCESIVTKPPTADVGHWMRLRGELLADGRIEIAVRCVVLSPDGTCGQHATRPAVCRNYAVGGAECRLTVQRRRPGNAAAILAAMPD